MAVSKSKDTTVDDKPETNVPQSPTTNKTDVTNTSTSKVSPEPVADKQDATIEPIEKPVEKPKDTAKKADAKVEAKPAEGMIRVRGRVGEGQIALFDVSRYHPNGQVMIKGQDEKDVWPTAGVTRALREARIESV